MTTKRAENTQAEPTTTPAVAGSGPGGIGTGVAFAWALSVQTVINAVSFVPGVGPGALLAGQPIGLRLAAALLGVVFAGVVFTQGEALRRGRRVAWIIQIAANALLVLFGLTVVPGAVTSLGKGRVGDLVVAVVLLIVSPLIVWLLTRKRTRAWIASVSSAEARARHGGTWLLWIALWAIIGGTAIAFAGYY